MPVTKTFPIIDESAYHSSVVPVGAVALNVTDPLPHLAALTDAVTAVGKAFKVAVTAVRDKDIHPLVVFLAAAKTVFVPVVV